MSSRLALLAFAALCMLASGCSNRSQSAAPAEASSPAGDATNSAAVPSQPAVLGFQASAADQDAIRTAIQDRLRDNRSLNLDAMEMVVDSIAVHGDQAQAHASFHVRKGGETGMTMEYFLQRGRSGWVVTNGEPADGNTQLPPRTNTQPGANTTESTPSMPDVDAFFKDHPTPKSN